MKINLLAYQLLIFCLASTIFSFGQEIENVSVTTKVIEPGKVRYIILYDLFAQYSNIPCTIKVKITTPNGSSFYLKEVSGDVGNMVFPGVKKNITWDYFQELIHFSGSIDLAVEATPSVKVPTKQKKTRPLPVVISPIYDSSKNYAIKLFLKGKEVKTIVIETLLTENTFSIKLPRKTKPKDDYQLSITDGTVSYFSNTFKVKPRLGRGWVFVALLAGSGYTLGVQDTKEN